MNCIEALVVAEQIGILPEIGTVLVACSGGRDSVALLYALAELDRGGGLVVATVDHGLHERAGDACRLVQDHAAQLGISSYVLEADAHGIAMGRGLEDGARTERLRLLENLANELAIGHIVTAHHAGDQAETVLMRWLEGTGWKGVGGIPAQRGPWRRPWLELAPGKIHDFVRARGLTFIQDPTNDDTRFERNRFRVKIAPILADTVGAGWEARVARSARRLRDERNGLLSMVDVEVTRLVRDGVEGRWGVKAPSSSQRTAIVRMTFARARKEYGEACPPWFERHIDAIVNLSMRTEHARSLDLGRGWRAVLWRGGFSLTSAPTMVVPPPSMNVTAPGLHEFGRWQVVIEEHPRCDSIHWIGASQMPQPWVLRCPHRGERFMPMNAPGRKRIRRIWGDGKVPREQRDDLPVLEAGGVVVWVANVRAAHGANACHDDRGFLISIERTPL